MVDWWLVIWWIGRYKVDRHICVDVDMRELIGRQEDRKLGM
jgi:hypothetical protein